LTQLRFERPEPELELGQKNNSPSKQLSKRDRNDWGVFTWRSFRPCPPEKNIF
jgi:hypothetical protein